MDKLDKRIVDTRFFQDFFKDPKNETITQTIKKICLAEQPTPLGTTGDLFAYRAGRQDVWNEILNIVNADIEQEQNKLQEIQNGQMGQKN